MANRAPSRPTGPSGIGTALCYLAGLALARLLWPLIRIPLGETYGIVSATTRSGFNPVNNIVRTAAFALLPPVLLLLCYRLRSFKTGAMWEKEITPGRSSAVTSFAGLLLVMAFALLLAANLWGSRAPSFDWFHDGESLTAGLSQVQGQVPYRDFLFIHGVLQDPGRAALAFALFGTSIGSLRAVDHLARALILLLVATFLWQIFRGRIAWVLLTLLGLAGLMASTAVGGEMLPFSPVLIQIRELPTLLFLNLAALIARRLEQQEAGHWAMAGLTCAYAFLPGVAYLVSVDRGLFLTAAMLLGLPLVFGGWAQGPRKTMALALSAGTGVLLGAAAIVAVLGAGSRGFLDYLTIYLPRYNALIVGIEYPINSPAFLVSQAMLSAAACFFTALLIRHFPPRPGGFAEAWRIFCRRRFLEVTLLTMSAIWFGMALTQADTWHLRLATLPMYLCLFYLVVRYGLDPLVARAGKARLLSRLGWACTLLLVLAGGVRLARGGVLANWLPVAVPDTRLVPAQMQLVADYMKTVMGPGDTFFATDSNPSWYYLAARICPARYPIAYLAAPPACQREIIQSLESSKVRFVLTTAGKDADARANLLSRRSLPLLNSHIVSAYKPLRQIGGVQVWERTR